MKVTFYITPLLLISMPALSADCDFDKPIGGCQARITIDSKAGSNGSYSAEVTVQSSAPSCSKVQFFIDNTPHTTVIKSGNIEGESVFGTRPISEKNLRILNCTAFVDRAVLNSPERQELVRRFGGCADDPQARQKIDAYNNDGSSLDSLIDFLPQGIAVNKDLGNTARVAFLNDMLATARACKARAQ